MVMLYPNFLIQQNYYSNVQLQQRALLGGLRFHNHEHMLNGHHSWGRQLLRPTRYVLQYIYIPRNSSVFGTMPNTPSTSYPVCFIDTGVRIGSIGRKLPFHHSASPWRLSSRPHAFPYAQADHRLSRWYLKAALHVLNQLPGGLHPTLDHLRG
mmetsp:Transcript_19155/g.32055  ORF Transcript_19155/g.32055 Transcript_19155/m.32055 type:complete len:153 (+) Transcript_19155:210-668(+)